MGVVTVPETATHEPAQERYQKGANYNPRARETEIYQAADSG